MIAFVASCGSSAPEAVDAGATSEAEAAAPAPGAVVGVIGGQIYYLSSGVVVEEYGDDTNRYYLLISAQGTRFERSKYEFSKDGLEVFTAATSTHFMTLARPSPGSLATVRGAASTALALDQGKAAAFVASITADTTPDDVIAGVRP